MAEPFIGQIQTFGFDFAPQGYAQCDGSLLPVNQYSALFSLLGVTYGGDGRTTFGLPDLRGRVPIHPNYDPVQEGDKGGSETVTLTEAQMPAHTHMVMAIPNGANQATTEGNFLAAGQNSSGTATNLYANGRSTTSLLKDSVDPQGSGQAHDNMQPFLTINFCIALTGIYPSRSS